WTHATVWCVFISFIPFFLLCRSSLMKGFPNIVGDLLILVVIFANINESVRRIDDNTDTNNCYHFRCIPFKLGSLTFSHGAYHPFSLSAKSLVQQYTCRHHHPVSQSHQRHKHHKSTASSQSSAAPLLPQFDLVS